MKEISYVILDPTGTLTGLVLDPVDPAGEPAVTSRLMTECEQVAYLETPQNREAAGRIRMMGGEFCGNAAMAAACYLAERDGLAAAGETDILLEVSGTEGILQCRVRPNTDEGRANIWQGTVPMPAVTEIISLDIEEFSYPVVRMPGIAHLIRTGNYPTETEAERILHRAAELLPDEAVGLLLRDREGGMMRPLVLVKGSRTLVWETGCGSGSAAIGALTAVFRGDGITETDVIQPGGTIRVRAEVRGGQVINLMITGNVR